MPMTKFSLTVLPEEYAVCRLAPTEDVPGWAHQAKFFSITKTDDELSIVAPFAAIPAGIKSAGPWRVLKVNGPLDFSMLGIFSDLSPTLENAGVPICMISTFDTDYVLVQTERLSDAIKAVESNGHSVSDASV